MLELKEISKEYLTGSEAVHALRGVSLTFRDNEFVSILGPSGCGKTTLLNIIGGLDRPSGGDLLINGVSTKEYREKDWNTYRNHKIGFIFQSYNLIPHQNALQNVELTMTLSGVPKHERRKRAKEALEKVGLGSQLKKKPSEMSGGQMQRIAIARALVNDPEIILADEPTGALDTETGIQIMDLLKELAKEHLVIMVTHNPELAENYSTRIIRMQDGQVLDDSMPFGSKERVAVKDFSAEGKVRGKKYAGMSFGTAFGLSLKNLISKKGRTILTGFAGSIGIIGISLIFAMSQGTSNYIDYVQEQTLASYPITIEQQHVDIGDLLRMFIGVADNGGEHEDGRVYQQAKMYQLVHAMSDIDMSENDLKELKVFLDEKMKDTSSENSISAVQYGYNGYNVDIPVYARDVDGNIIRSDTQLVVRNIMKDYLGMDISQLMEMNTQTIFSGTTRLMTESTALWRELLTDVGSNDISRSVLNNYELLYGHWPEKANEVVLFISGNNEIDDVSLYALGIKPASELSEMMDAYLEHTDVELEGTSFSYEEICDMELTTIPTAELYTANGDGTFSQISGAELERAYENGIRLTVCAVAKPNENSIISNDITYLGYLPSLRDMLGEANNEGEAVKAQLENPDTDVLTGKPFRKASGWSKEEKLSLINSALETMTDVRKAELYARLFSEYAGTASQFDPEAYITSLSRAELNEFMLAGAEEMGMNTQMIELYTASMSDDMLKSMILSSLTDEMKEQMAQAVGPEMQEMPQDTAELFDAAVSALTEEEMLSLFEDIVELSDSTLEDNLKTLGYFDKEDPSTVNIYATDFASKDRIEELIAEYNSTKSELAKITYTDYVGLMMSSITSIINAITYVLMAFVSVSLIVSSIMIGVITLISVQERIKEIGILRAMGASKRNVSSLFNAETIIVGFVAGTIGVGITYLLCIPINLLLRSLTGMTALKAYLPPAVAAVLIVISMLLTLIAGIIPSRSAARKDPVVALRTE